jgi:tRNA(adenine34) deaminase
MDYEYFMKKALAKAKHALAEGEFPVGCVMVYQGKVLVDAARRGTVGGGGNEIDHAEMVALRRLLDLGYQVDSSEIAVFCTMEPCLMCYSALILAGIGKIVYAYEDVMGGGTGCKLSKLTPLYRSSAIKVVPHIMRTESLEIFRSYFSNPATTYWKHSLLADYTLGQ